MEFLKLLLGLKSQLLSGGLRNFLAPKQASLLEGKVRRSTWVRLDLVTWILPFGRRTLGLQAMLLEPVVERLVCAYERFRLSSC